MQNTIFLLSSVRLNVSFFLSQRYGQIFSYLDVRPLYQKMQNSNVSERIKNTNFINFLEPMNSSKSIVT